MDRLIEDERSRKLLIRFLEEQGFPFVVTVTKGRKRSYEQNRLQRLWCNEVAEQLGDQEPEDVRAYCKLSIGVPLLRAENAEFCEAYDKHVKPLPYETKLACMREPLDFPVTRLMTSKQKARFLDLMFQYWTERGVKLTEPDQPQSVAA